MEKLSQNKFAKFLKMLSLASTLGFSACAAQPPYEPPQLNLKEKEGKPVPVKDILDQPIPEAYLQKISDLVDKHKRGLIISKGYNIHYLFDNGVVINRGPVGTAKTSMGYTTPVGEHKVSRKEGKDYTSGEFPGAVMAYAIFFTENGKAFHTSTNYVVRYNREREAKEVYLLINSSHGCANALLDDAHLANVTLKIGDPVIVLE